MMNNYMAGRKLIPNPENSLQKLVEEYLICNVDRTYIDMDDMVAALQHKSYRFARMKKQAFAHLVKKAYYSYCEANEIYYDKESNENQSSKRSYQNNASDSESEIQIEDSHGTTMSNQLNGLYQQVRPVASVSSPRSGQECPIRPTKRHFDGEKRQEMTTRTMPRTEVPLIKPSSSTSVPIARNLSRNVRNSSTESESLLKPDDDEDDLQIIDEFPKNATAASIHRSTNSSNRSVSTEGKTIDSPSSVKLFTRGIVKNEKSTLVSPAVIRNNGDVTTSPKKENRTAPPPPVISQPSSPHGDSQIEEDSWKMRGTKRKLDKNEFLKTLSSAVSDKFETKIGKKNRKEIVVQNSIYTFEDFGGSEKLLEDICKLLMHLKHPEMYRTLGVIPPRGFLLHGPPGCGKTLLAQAIAGELKLPILKMAATELISGISGESESNIRDVFEQGLNLAPCIIFMDEIDSITPKRETASKEMERRIVSQLLACIDDLVAKPKGDQVLLIGATSRIEAIDISLRRAGRFDREICLGIPNERAREKILRVISKGLKLEPTFSFELLAKVTPGYVGADLQALIREAAVQSVTEILYSRQDSKPIQVNENLSEVEVDVSDLPTMLPMDVEPTLPLEAVNFVDAPIDTAQITPADPQRWINETAPLSEAELANFCIHMENFEKALKNVQPSAKREGFATVPDTTWDDIGALKDIRDELQVSILGPVKHASAFKMLGLNAPAGVLLCGPPGCGKTLLAKAVANEAGINFISVKGPELLNMYVGESERAVRQCFQRAKNSSPCVIFFDELDSLCPRRSDGFENGSSSRVVNQLLTEMDGMESRIGVFVMGATNRPDIIDPAILRPGRLDKILFVNLPSPVERVDILKAITKNGPTFADDVKIEEIGTSEKSENYTGADLASLVREAGIAAFRELVLEPSLKNDTMCQDSDLKVYQRHFEQAFDRTKPSVSQKDREKYAKMKELHSVFSK